MGMRVLVTGASGFIGNNLLPRLLDEGHNVIAYDLKPPIYKDHACGHTRIITGDLSSGEGLDQIVWEEVDAVVHLAAAGVKASRRNWSECISVNIVGTEQLIHAMSRISTQPLIIYPRTFYEDYLNEFPDLKNNPYIVTKTAGTKIIELWARNNKNARLVFGTIFQAYGPGDDPGNVLSYTAECLKSSIPTKLGSDKSLRDWIYINDLIDAFIRTLNFSGDRIQYFDFGTGKLTSLRKMVETLAQLMGKPKSLLHFDVRKDRGDMEINAKAKNFLSGWKIHYSVEQGLTSFVQAVENRNNKNLE